MDLVRDLISLGRNAREEVKIKVRQPISKIVLDGNKEEILGDLKELIREELNVKEIEFTKELDKYMTFEIKPNFKVCGKEFGPSIKELQDKLLNLSDEDKSKVVNNETITLNIAGEDKDITPEMVDVRINAKEGFDAAFMNNNFVIIDTVLTDELINEGIVRELISKVQNLRKEKDFNVVDRIKLIYSGDIAYIIDNYKEIIMKETLANEIEVNDKLTKEYDLNGKIVKLDVKKIDF